MASTPYPKWKVVCLATVHCRLNFKLTAWGDDKDWFWGSGRCIPEVLDRGDELGRIRGGVGEVDEA